MAMALEVLDLLVNEFAPIKSPGIRRRSVAFEMAVIALWLQIVVYQIVHRQRSHVRLQRGVMCNAVTEISNP